MLAHICSNSTDPDEECEVRKECSSSSAGGWTWWKHTLSSDFWNKRLCCFLSVSFRITWTMADWVVDVFILFVLWLLSTLGLQIEYWVRLSWLWYLGLRESVRLATGVLWPFVLHFRLDNSPSSFNSCILHPRVPRTIVSRWHQSGSSRWVLVGVGLYWLTTDWHCDCYTFFTSRSHHVA